MQAHKHIHAGTRSQTCRQTYADMQADVRRYAGTRAQTCRHTRTDMQAHARRDAGSQADMETCSEACAMEMDKYGHTDMDMHVCMHSH